MDLFTVLHTRRSIRKFTEKDVADVDLEKILTAAMAAPSAGNQQPWEFIIIRDRKKLNAIMDIHPYANMLASAPVAVMVCGRIDCRYPTFWPQDCSAATQNMLLAARALEIGSCWTGVYPEQERINKMHAICAIPETVIPFALVALGYSDTHFREVNRFDGERIFSENYGTVKVDMK